MAPVPHGLDELIKLMDGMEGFDWDPDWREFLPRQEGPAAGEGPLTVRQALERIDPERYHDRSNDPVCDHPRPPMEWPPWAW